MGKHRDGLDIVADVLKAAIEGAGKTRIMYRANLSYKLLGKYLEATVERGFLRSDGSRFELTESGKDFLERYDRFNDQYSKVQGSLKDLNGERQTLQRLCRESETKIE
jgi:predicted transcriptional regulator